MITEQQTMTDEKVHELATIALNEIDALVPSVCSGVFRAYLTEQGFNAERFQPETFGQIVDEVRRLEREIVR